MKEFRLSWEPENLTPLSVIETRFNGYLKGKLSGVTLLGNGTLLFSRDDGDNEDVARRAMEEAKFLIDFEVTPLKEGGFLVGFHKALAVFVGQEEFVAVREEVKSRLAELKLPGEEFIENKSSSAEHLLIGLYARGKLQRDAFNFKFYKRISCTS